MSSQLSPAILGLVCASLFGASGAIAQPITPEAEARLEAWVDALAAGEDLEPLRPGIEQIDLEPEPWKSLRRSDLALLHTGAVDALARSTRHADDQAFRDQSVREAAERILASDLLIRRHFASTRARLDDEGLSGEGGGEIVARLDEAEARYGDETGALLAALESLLGLEDQPDEKAADDAAHLAEVARLARNLAAAQAS